MFRSKVSSVTNEIKQLKKSLFKKDSFAQNFAFVFSGKAVAIVVQVIFAPILARIYSPEAYGVFSVFTAVSVNLALIATLRLEGALVLPRENEEFGQLLKAVVLIALVFSGLITLISLIANRQIVFLLKAGDTGWLYYTLGPVVFLISLFQITNNWVIRNKAFKDSFHYGIPVNISTRVFNLVYGIFTKGAAHGLILADILNKAITVFLRLVFILKSGLTFLSIRLSWENFRGLVKKYRQFPLFDMPGSWVNLFSAQLPIYIVTLSFGALAANYVGQLGFAINLLDIPMGLLGSSMAPVFLQRISEAQHSKPDEIGRLTISLFKKLLYIGILPFAILTAFGDIIFAWIFGARWEMAGVFTAYLGVYYLFRLISSPLSSVFVVLNRQQKLFAFQLFLFVGRAIVLAIGAFVLRDIFWVVLLFGIFNAVAYFLVAIWILHLTGAPKKALVIETIALVLIVTGGLMLLRFVLWPW